MNQNTQKIIELSDGVRSSTEIAKIVGLSPRYVRKVMKKKDLPRLKSGPPRGEKNPSWVGGRIIDLDGYVTVPAPVGHPFARKIGRIAEHRLVMEQKLGRYLTPEEVVDHIDGLKLHNHPDNLRLFGCNGEHLASTITGTPRNWSASGRKNIGTRSDLGKEYQPVDSYRQRKASGDEALLQILLLAFLHGTDSPYLSGMHRLLEKKQIDYSSRTKIKHALDGLCRKYELNPPQLQS